MVTHNCRACLAATSSDSQRVMPCTQDVSVYSAAASRTVRHNPAASRSTSTL